MKLDIPCTGKDAIKFLKENKKDILEFKRKEPLKTADMFEGLLSTGANKASLSAKRWLYENDTENGILKRSLAINTYNWMDSQDDVHLDGIFTSSIKQKSAKPAPHLHDHVWLLGSKVGNPIAWKEVQVSWRELGVNKSGTTTVLVLESEILKSMNEQIYNMYLKDEIDQHSVGMRYITVNLAVNDADDDYWADEYKVWQEAFPRLGNPEKAEAQGYFFAIREGEVKEGSAVLFGANELTPTLGTKFEPSKDIQTKFVIEPAKPFDVDAFLNKHW